MDISDDFDDDFDDILQSDDDIPKKPKSTAFINSVKVNDEKIDVNTSVHSVVQKNVLQKNDKKSLNDKLFLDEIDHISSLDSVQAKEPPNKPAKSVLESLLNPSKELNDMNFSFAKSNIQSNTSPNWKTEAIDEKKDELFSKDEYRPSTGNNHKAKDSIANPIANKRSVHFSTETLGDDKPDFEASLNRSRPQTAPNANTIDLAKPKFYSRFEAAEFDEIPTQSTDNIQSTTGSGSSLWRDSKSEESTSLSGNGIKQKIDMSENNKAKDSNRSAPKQKLTEFMQSSQEELLTSMIDKPKLSNFSEISFVPRRSSNEDLLDSRSRTSSNIIDDFNFGRRSSVPKDIPLDRPKTAHNRYDKIQIKAGGSHESDFPFDDNTDYLLKIKHLETERDELVYKLEKMTKRNMEELEMKEKSYKHRIEILEENMQSKERRFKEEIDLLSEQNKQKLQMLEQERLDMRSELSRRQDDMEIKKSHEISRIREQHKLEVEKLRFEHDDLIAKLHQAKNEEDATIRLAQPTTMQLQSVLAQVSSGTQDLVSIKEQLMDQVKHQIKEKDAQLKEKNEYLRQLEERLDAQKDENARERERLQTLISKLDIQLKEQMRTAEEERWFLRQEQNKIAALQSSLDKEREQILIEKDQNRLSQEEFRKRVLDEQKQMLDQIYEEKRNMAEERSKLTREMFKWSETNQMSNVKKNQEMAELEGMRSALTEERRELDRMRSQIANDREEFLAKSSKLDSTSYEVRMKAEKLNILEKELNTRQKLLNDKEENFREIETRGEEALKKAKELHLSHDDQISKIQKQLAVLNQTEKNVNKQQMELEQYRSQLLSKEKSITCSKCSGSLRNVTIGGSYNSLNRLPMNGFATRNSDLHLNTRLSATVDQEIRDSMEYSSFVVSEMEKERLIHSIRLAADNDREFLNQERAYLDSLVSGSLPVWKAHVKG